MKKVKVQLEIDCGDLKDWLNDGFELDYILSPKNHFTCWISIVLKNLN